MNGIACNLFLFRVVIPLGDFPPSVSTIHIPFVVLSLNKIFMKSHFFQTETAVYQILLGL